MTMETLNPTNDNSNNDHWDQFKPAQKAEPWLYRKNSDGSTHPQPRSIEDRLWDNDLPSPMGPDELLRGGYFQEP